MNDAFLDAVIDTILPGETGGAEKGAALPSGTAAGITLCLDGPHGAILASIAEGVGGADGFVAAASPAREASLAAVEKRNFDALRALVTALVQDYYETPAVIAAMGWRAGGAQPLGHHVAEADATTLALLDKVRARGPIWRDPSGRQE